MFKQMKSSDSMYYRGKGCISMYIEKGKDQNCKETGIFLEDITKNGVFSKGDFQSPLVLTNYFNERGKCVQTHSHECFNSVWGNLSNITALSIQKPQDWCVVEGLPTIPWRNLFYYVRQMKKFGVFPNYFMYKDIRDNKELHFDLSYFVNGLHFYNFICSWRNIWDKPQVVNNAVNLHKMYKLTWAEAMYLSLKISTPETYFSVFNVGCDEYTFFREGVLDVHFMPGMLVLFNTMFQNPGYFGEETVNSVSTRRFYTYRYFTTVTEQKGPYAITGRFSDIVVDTIKTMKVSDYLKGKERKV